MFKDNDEDVEWLDWIVDAVCCGGFMGVVRFGSCDWMLLAGKNSLDVSWNSFWWCCLWPVCVLASVVSWFVCGVGL